MIILIQGAMEIEINRLISFYRGTLQELEGYKFYLSNYKGHQVIISLTNQGIKNADKATLIAINNYKPDLIINTGVCGSHDKYIEVGDIVIANKATYLNTKEVKIEINSSENLVNLIKKDIHLNEGVKFVTFGSGDVFSTDPKKIIKLRNYFSHDTEDMESIGVYYQAEKHNIKRIGIRIISNNELINQKYDDNIDKVKDKIQDYVIKCIDKFIS